jgi:hypothetical protein
MSQPLVIRFGTLHDQLGPPKGDGVLLSADGRVAEVDAGAAGLDVPDGALVVDAACVTREPKARGGSRKRRRRTHGGDGYSPDVR